jgi:hypothetical protein
LVLLHLITTLPIIDSPGIHAFSKFDMKETRRKMLAVEVFGVLGGKA